MPTSLSLFFFSFNDTATPEIYTLSLHDALPISFSVKTLSSAMIGMVVSRRTSAIAAGSSGGIGCSATVRSEEHTSELQSLAYLVCRLLLEKKKNICDT